MSEPSDVTRRTILDGLRKAGGKATLGDLMASTALPAEAIEQNVLAALTEVEGHVAVDDKGELVYALGRRRRPRTPGTWARFVHMAGEVVKNGYYVALVLFLIGYFAFYVALLLAIAVAGLALLCRGGDGCDCDCGGCDCDGCDCGGCDCCITEGCSKTSRKSAAAGAAASAVTAAAAPAGSPPTPSKKQVRREQRLLHREARRERYEARRAARRDRRAARIQSLRRRGGLSPVRAALGLTLEQERVTLDPPWSRKVRDYIFGPPPPRVDTTGERRNLLAFVRDNHGRLTASDVVMLTGRTLEHAEAIALELAARYEGDLEVTDDGVIVYTFERLATSASESDEVLDWLAAAERVSVEAFAEHVGVDAATARERLSRIARQVGAREEHGATSVFVFGERSGKQLDRLRDRQADLRNYTLAWEQLERSPAVVGVPEGKRGWIVGLNTVNLLMASMVSLVLEDATQPVVIFEEQWGPLFSPTIDFWVLGLLPLAFSAGVFGIPVARACWVWWTDRGRLRRNARRVFLLGLFHCLASSKRVRADQIAAALFGADVARGEVDRHLEWAARALDGTVDEKAGVDAQGSFTWVFERLHEELKASEQGAPEVDLSALGVGRIVFSSADAG